MAKKITIGIIIFIVVAVSLRAVIGWINPITEDDFELTISVSSQEFNQGQDIDVHIEFRNLRWRTHFIERGNPLIVPFIVDCVEYGGVYFYCGIRQLVAARSLLGVRATRRITISMGRHLPAGEHELMADAIFSIRQNRLRIVSSVIILSVN